MSAAPRVAGLDTRQAWSMGSVRAAAHASAFVAAPAWVAMLIAPSRMNMPAETRPWFVVALSMSALVAGSVAGRRPARVARDRIAPHGADAVLVMIVAALTLAIPRDETVARVALGTLPALGGWAIGSAMRFAQRSVAPSARSAAAGLVVTWSAVGTIGATHLALVHRGSGSARAAAWMIVYLAVGLLHLARAWRASLDSADVRVAPVEGREQPGDATVEARAVIVRFGDRTVLDRAHLAARSGEVVALVGGNGSGKSTLLRVIAGMLVPSDGMILLDGEDVSGLLAEERAAAGLAFVSGARPVFPELSVLENLRVAAYRTHVTRRAFTRATDAILETVAALATRRHAPAAALSGGEQRILAVAQTLYGSPKAVLADELTLGLDRDARVAVLDLLRRIADEGAAVIAVDHDLPTLLPRADRAALLADGTITDLVPATRVLDVAVDALPAAFLVGATR